MIHAVLVSATLEAAIRAGFTQLDQLTDAKLIELIPNAGTLAKVVCGHLCLFVSMSTPITNIFLLFLLRPRSCGRVWTMR